MEEILCVPRAVLDRTGAFQGLTFDTRPYLEAIFDPANNLFLPRAAAETDPSHKQIIPYAVISCGGRVLHYRRGGGGGEKRLVTRESIGFGGHLNPSDQPHLDAGAYVSLVLRELNEELETPEPLANRIVAILNDDSTEVGRVHIGVVHHIELPEARAAAREPDIEEPVFRSVEEVRARAERLEEWSRIVLGQIERVLGGSAG